MAHYHEPELYTGSEESGSEDSDEDIITDYLSPQTDDNGNLDAASPSAQSKSVYSPGSVSVAANSATSSALHASLLGAHNSIPSMEACGGTSPTASGMDDVSTASTAEPIPIISVTQHSPAASKAFFILEDNLRQLHGIQESIQRMRQVSLHTLRLEVGRRRLRGGNCNWSLSCPSLNGIATGAGGGSNNNESDWALLGCGSALVDWDTPTPPGSSLGSSGAHHLWGDSGGGGSRKGSLAGGGSKRRRSWASPWEADEMGLASASAGGVGADGVSSVPGGSTTLHSTFGVGGEGRPRSVSLSSVETDDNDQEQGGAEGSSRSRSRKAAANSTFSSGTSPNDRSDGIFSSRGLKVLTGGHSTHSLNDMGFPLQLTAAMPVKPRAASKDSGSSGGGIGGEPNKWLSPRILTLQKSISTPSILAVKDGSTVAGLNNKSPALLTTTGGPVSVLTRMTSGPKEAPSGPSVAGPTSLYPRSTFLCLESETDDDSELPLDHHHRSSSYLMGNISVEPGFENEDDANSSKRRKRGSIFFRKRKDKDKEKEKEKEKSGKVKQPHQFVPVCHSNSQPCDVCSKSLTNKAALRCESCAITVHENSCRDQASDCTRFKVPKSVPPLGSRVSLASLSIAGSAKPNHPIGSTSTSALPSTATLAATPATSASTSVIATGSSSSSWSASASAQMAQVVVPHSSSSTVSTVTTPTAAFVAPSISSPLFNSSKSSASTDKEQDTASAAAFDDTYHAPNDNEGPFSTTGTASSVAATSSDAEVNVADVKDLDLDPELGILDEEAEAWVGTVDKKTSKKLKDKEVKRQEHIYEFIITEKHHCLTLKVMQKIFAEGMRREMRFTSETVDRIFPCLEELIEYHLNFLRRLRHRQRQEPIVATIEDILRVQFSGPLGDQLRSLYGEFCSRHQEAVSMYKEMIKEDRKFAAFARQCTMNPLCKKKGIPECILFVTQRITKYPLLIDPLIKTSREQPEECLKLQEVLSFVKDILIGVNAQVAEKERKLRLIEVYNKIDAKSATTYRNKKFKKSDLLSSTRRLMFEGVAYLNHARGKVQLVTVVVLSDVVFFLQESNQKFHFVTQDNKAGVISLQKLLVREKAGGQDTRSIYLISSNPDEPEMYELQCQTPREKRVWIDTIRAAVEQCPEDEEGDVSEGEEEQRKIREAQDIKTRQLVGVLRDKDRQLASLLEDKMATFCELVELLANNEDSTNSWVLLGSESGPPKYGHLVEHGFHSPQARETLTQAMGELCRLLGILFSSNLAGGWAISRSTSSVGERHSDTFSLPLLPKRAETFGGFDAQNGAVKKKSSTELNVVENDPSVIPVVASSQIPPVLQLNGEQQAAGLELVHNVSSLLCLLSSQATDLEASRAQFQAEVKANRSGLAFSAAPVGSGPAVLAKFQHKASHNQRLEELRNLQDRLSKEKAEWQRERAMQEEQLGEQRKQLLKLQEQVRVENTDVQQQRENLYQKLEALRGQGILLSPNMTIVSTAPMSSNASSTSAVSPSGGEADSEPMSASSPPPPIPPSGSSLLPSPTPSSADIGRRKTISAGPSNTSAGLAGAGLLKRDSSSNLPLPINLLSAKNEQKTGVALATNLPIKQQLPMKLAKLAASGGSGSASVALGQSSASSSLSGGGNLHGHATVGSPSPSSGGGLVQQLLPLRLSESLEHKKSTASPKLSTDSFKPKLSSSSFSPPASKSEDFVAGHNRTGSSPASIQMLSPRHLQQQQHNQHPYHLLSSHPPPKIPEKPASLLLREAARGSPQMPPPPPSSSHHHHHHQHDRQAPPQPAKVHDPDTNQEIVFL